MKTWQRILSIASILIIGIGIPLLVPKNEKECCLCNSFRYHAPCLIDLETGNLIELDLYSPHPTLVAELAEFQPPGQTFSLVSIGNASGIKQIDSRRIEIDIPKETTRNPALCKACRKLLPLGFCSRYILADLYDKEKTVLIPIQANRAFSLRCYEVTITKDIKTGNTFLVIQGTYQTGP